VLQDYYKQIVIAICTLNQTVSRAVESLILSFGLKLVVQIHGGLLYLCVAFPRIIRIGTARTERDEPSELLTCDTQSR
jgi:hypothetical protein